MFADIIGKVKGTVSAMLDVMSTSDLEGMSEYCGRNKTSSNVRATGGEKTSWLSSLLLSKKNIAMIINLVGLV